MSGTLQKPCSKFKKIELALFGGTALIAFALDRASKLWALATLPLHQTMPGLGSLYNFYLVKNTGAAFSMGKDNSTLVLVIALATTLGLTAWALMRLKAAVLPQYFERAGAGLIIGSSLGNLFDRFYHGQVTDFIQFGFIDFPVFNVADALIDVGIVLIFIQQFLASKKQATSSETKND